jgi:spore maturation protein CgeB
MKLAFFYHSLISDWNHGNAHFLRGIVSELKARGHHVAVYEPRDAWSVENLLKEYGDRPLRDFAVAYSGLSSIRYDLPSLDLDQALDGCDLAIVHEWSDHDLVRRIGEHRKRGGDYLLFFHDTHHRAVSAPEQMAAYDFSGFDGVLAYGETIRRIYLEKGWMPRAWTWHEAADTRVFKPVPDVEKEGDVVWIGNWGDEERTAELHEFLLDPVKVLGLKARVHGVRYPGHALEALHDAGIEYGGWLPNFRVPEVFARFKVTVHVPRRPYVEALPGIPTIRPFEAMACGIPLVCSPWDDAEHLFTPGEDYLIARDGTEMQRHLQTLLNDSAYAAALAEHGRQTVLARHTCAHRVDELMAICEEMGLSEERKEEKREREPATSIPRSLAPLLPLS